MERFEDAVVALVPVLQAADHIGLGGPRLQAHEGVVEVILGGVELRGKVVALGLTLLAGQRGVLGLLVHVVGDGAHVVEELRVDGPAAVFFPNGLADDPPLAFLDGVFEEEALTLEDAVAQSLVRGTAVVGGLGGAGEPTLVDAAAVRAQGIPVGRRQLDPLARMEEVPRHPIGGKLQDPFGGVHRTIQGLSHVVLGDDFRCAHDLSNSP